MTLSTVTNHPRNKVRIKRTREFAPMWGRALAIAMVTGFLVGTAKAEVLYVSAVALPGGDGQTWSTAHRFLQDALAAAGPGSGVTEIRVAQGVYKPDRSKAAPNGTGNRDASFQLVSGVALRGGYAGSGSDDPGARDWEVHETILSGDLAGNDGPNFENYGDNSYTVVTGSDTDATAVIEGFIIERGNANDTATANTSMHRRTGGGMFSQSGSPTMQHCSFRLNKAIGGGGGAFRSNSQPLIESCTFIGNRSEIGGAIHCFNGSHATIVECKFLLNEATHGGAIRTYKSDVTITDSTFEQNKSDSEGGAIKFENGFVTVERCTFIGNSANGPGGAINMTSAGDNPEKGACFSIVDCEFIGNHSSVTGGAVQLLTTCDSSEVVRCSFSNNTGGMLGGAILANAPAGKTIRFLDCTITHNSIDSWGIGLWGSGIVILGDITMTNCLIANNHAASGAPAVSYAGYPIGPQLTNCTISHNVGSGVAVLDENEPMPILIQNSIIWGNTQGQIDDNPLALVFNSNIQGGWSGAGDNNINADPLFVQPGMGNYRLSEGSSCIDIGDNSALPPDVTTDLAGNPRILNGIVDLGAYEGEHESLIAAAMEKNLPPGETAVLSPLGPPSPATPMIHFTNESDDVADLIVVTHQHQNPHPEAFGYTFINHAMNLTPSLPDGDFRASLFLPFTQDDLNGMAPDEMRISRFDEQAGKWVLAVNQNISGSTAGPIVQIGMFLTTWNDGKGSHGVFWNPIQQTGIAWANVDRSGLFSVAVNTCPADLVGNGKVGIMDALYMFATWKTADPVADLNGDGIVDLEDLLLLLSAWGPCPWG